MKLFSKIFAGLFIGFSGITAYAQYAEITKIDSYQWKVTWEDADWVNPLNVILDNPDYMASVMTLDEERLAYLYYDKQVTFPSTGNYLTVNIGSLGLDAGDYLLYIPEGYVSLNPQQTSNAEQYFEISLGGSVDLSYPVIFSEISDNTFQISWENVTSLQPGDTTGAYMVNVGTDERYELYYLQGQMYSQANLRISGEYLNVNLTNNYPDLPDGTYKLYIPAGYVKFNGTEKTNDAIEGYEFVYVAPWTEGPVEAEGPTEDNLLVVTWLDATEVVYNTNYKGDGFGVSGISIYDSESVPISVEYPQNISFEENVMIIDLNGIEGMTYGDCQLVVPEGVIYVTVNGVTGLTAGVVYRFRYEDSDRPIDPDLPEYEEFDGNVSWSIGEKGEIFTDSNPVEVSWQGNRISPVGDAENEISVFGNNTGYRELIFGDEIYISPDETKLCIDLSKLQPDTYRVNLPAGYVYIFVDQDTYINGYSSLEQIVVTGKSSEEENGIDFLETFNGVYRVFTLQGIKVMEVKDYSQLSGLKGIYIINGKKVNL